MYRGRPSRARTLQTPLPQSAGFGSKTATRPDARAWSFYMAYNMFRLAAILQGVMARAVAGNASSARAVEAGRRARPLAERGWSEVERMTAGG